MKAEPSMEQILASIRKIMAEEAAGQPVASLALAPDMPENAADNILELTELVEESTPPDAVTEVNPQIKSSAPPTIVEDISTTRERESPEVIENIFQTLENTQSSTVEPLSVNEHANNRLQDTGASPLDQDSFKGNIRKAPLESGNFTGEPLLASGVTPLEFSGTSAASLLSDHVRHVGVHAIQELLQASGKKKEPEKMKDPLKGGTIDEIMEDLLRPLLSTWLNQNLPTLVEKIVREEIRRLVDRV